MKRINKKINNQKGITLIALVVTIVVMLILAGITISTITSQQENAVSSAGKLKNDLERRDIIEEIRRRKYDFEQINGRKANASDLVEILGGTGLTYDSQTDSITKENSSMDPIELSEIGEFSIVK